MTHEEYQAKLEAAWEKAKAEEELRKAEARRANGTHKKKKK